MPALTRLSKPLQEAGILISPTDSSTAPSVLSLAEKANIPVVIADIGDIKEVALDQMQRCTADETFKYVQNMLMAHPDLRGIPDLGRRAGDRGGAPAGLGVAGSIRRRA